MDQDRDPFSLQGKRIVVAGAAGAIGSSICRTLSNRGATVLGFDIIRPQTDTENGSQNFTLLDGLREDCVAEYASAQLASPVDAIICAQGVVGEIKDAERIDMQLFRDCLMASVDSSAILVKSFTPQLKTSGRGAIVLISSTAGLRGAALMPAYTAAKHAAIGLVKSYARELGPWGIRVNAVLPGLIESPMAATIHTILEQRRNPSQPPSKGLPNDLQMHVPLRRIGNVQDVTNAVHFLVSDASSYCNGTLLNVDGGTLVRY